jgi:hypothetical protein
MPIKRFADHLHREGQTEEYMKLLVDNFNPAAAEGVMCRDLVSVSWVGPIRYRSQRHRQALLTLAS